MSKTIRKTKTRDKARVSSQYGVADWDPADLDFRQTRHTLYIAAPPVMGGTWKDKVQNRQKSESPIFISTTPDAMSTDEALEISKQIDEEVAQEELRKETEQSRQETIVEEPDTLPTVSELQTAKRESEVYEEIKEGLGDSGVISFPKLERQ